MIRDRQLREGGGGGGGQAVGREEGVDVCTAQIQPLRIADTVEFR
jgi:hypothetical protein